MRPMNMEPYFDERVTVLTDGERIEGRLFYMGGARLSDFLNAPLQQEFRFVKIKDATVTFRRTGEEVAQVPFVMIARERILLVMIHDPDPVAIPNDDRPAPPSASASDHARPGARPLF